MTILQSTGVAFTLLVGVNLTIAAQEAKPGPTDSWRLVERAVQRQGVQDEFDTVLEHMRGIEAVRSNVGNRLNCVLKGLAEPWTPPAISMELLQSLSKPLGHERQSFAELGGDVAGWLDIEGYQGTREDGAHAGLQEMRELWDEIMDPALAGVELLQTMSAYVSLAHTIVEESLLGYREEQLELLFGGYADFYEAYYRDHFPSTPISAEQQQSINNFKGLLRSPKTDRAVLLGVADGLLKFAEPTFQSTLGRRLAKVRSPGMGRDILAVVGDEACERVVLSGRKKSTHSEPAALIIDLGGDDQYTRAAVVDAREMLVSVVIDLGGDDTYSASGPGPAFAAGGVALLVDRKGEDTYTSKRLGQAATVLGFAALIDQEGDDQYVAEDYSQGHACCGVALLYDVSGKDTYKAWAFAQGGGIGYGLCALVDGAGDDSYLADLTWPDVYGNSGPDVYHGASQGYCTGIRSDIAGGIAALLDLGEGQDRYQSGSFSQGGGYYFSFGLMYDGGGDDENFGSRYSQGFGVHQGIGVRWDAGGDDEYTCRSVAHTGMGWDEGVGYFLEDGGDDQYRTGDLSCGGAAQTAIAIHIDRGGADTYQTGRQSQGGAGGSEYHNKPALGILIDLGGKKDIYSQEQRGNDSVRVTKGLEVFLDMKAKDMQKALKSKLLR